MDSTDWVQFGASLDTCPVFPEDIRIGMIYLWSDDPGTNPFLNPPEWEQFKQYLTETVSDEFRK